MKDRFDEETPDMFGGELGRLPRNSGSVEGLAHARKAWQAAIHGAGGHCPVCARWGKVNLRSINIRMAQNLWWMYRQEGDEEGWLYMPRAPQVIVRSNQHPTLKYGGLVERKPNSGDPKVKHSGLWRVTSLGKAFCEHRARVPKTLGVYNDEVVFRSVETTDFRECLKSCGFDYAATLKWTPPVQPTATRDPL